MCVFVYMWYVYFCMYMCFMCICALCMCACMFMWKPRVGMGYLPLLFSLNPEFTNWLDWQPLAFNPSAGVTGKNHYALVLHGC